MKKTRIQMNPFKEVINPQVNNFKRKIILTVEKKIKKKD